MASGSNSRDRLPAYDRAAAAAQIVRSEKGRPDDSDSFTYVYRLAVGLAEAEFTIQVDQPNSSSNEHMFSLSIHAAGISRPLCKPTGLLLNSEVDISRLDFACFVFPPKQSIPENSLYSLRVWLRVGPFDHRLFADELWFAVNPDFVGIPHASTTVLTSSSLNRLVYNAYLGSGTVNFIVRRTALGGSLYDIALDYEADGVGKTLVESIPLRIQTDLSEVSFVLYLVPKMSKPAGATHSLRLWVCAPTNEGLFSDPRSSRSSLGSQTRNYICQRIWKSDDFKVGYQLDFEIISPQVSMGVRVGAPMQGSISGFPSLRTPGERDSLGY